MPIVYRARALADAEEATDWYEAIEAGLGARFADELHRTVLRLADHPQSGALTRLGVRVTHIPVFWYRVFYLAEDSQIVVLAVRHPAKRPPNLANLKGDS